MNVSMLIFWISCVNFLHIAGFLRLVSVPLIKKRGEIFGADISTLNTDRDFQKCHSVT